MTSASRLFGEFLINRMVLSHDSLEAALAEERATGVPLIKILAAEGTVGERDLTAAVADQLGVAFWDPATTPIALTVSGLLPAPLARRLRAVAISDHEDQLVVAMVDPTDKAAISEIGQATGWQICPAMAARGDIDGALTEMYGPVAKLATDHVDGGRVDGPPGELHLDTLLTEMVGLGASDLHLSSGRPPSIRIDGEISNMTGYPVLIPSEIRRLVYGILTERKRERFEEGLELDTSHAVPGVGRFRVNVFVQRDSVGAVLRAIPFKVPPLVELGLPKAVVDLAYLPRGLVLVTGPTGSGKSTTLASIVDLINSSRPLHIMTVEDPIEFLHTSKRCVVNQREVGEDTKSFAEALKHVLRQDPDVILVGEMRDLETVSMALTAAETGHLVLGTLHTQDAPQSIDRVIDVFSSGQQSQIRVQLANSLQAVVTQQLLPRMGGHGRVAACEILVATSAVRNLIREGKGYQLYSSMQGGSKYGMQTMDHSLATLVTSAKVTMEAALERAHDENDLRRLISGAR